MKKKILTLLVLSGVVLVGFYTLVFWLAVDLDESLLVRGAEMTQLPAVAGQPVRWQALVPASVLEGGRHLLSLPASAQQVKIVRGAPAEIEQLASRGRDQAQALASLDRSKLAERSLAYASQTKNKSTSAGFGGSFLLGNAGEAVADLAEAIIPPAPVVADLAEAVPVQVVPAEEPIIELAPADLSATADESAPATEVAPAEEPVVEPAPVDLSAEADETLAETQTESDSNATERETEAVTTETDEETNGNSNSNGNGNSNGNRNSNSSTGGAGGSQTAEETETVGDITGATIVAPDTQSSDTTTPAESLVAPLATTTVPLATTTDLVLVEYETPAPTLAEAKTETGKLVAVSADDAEAPAPIRDVLAFTTIPELYKVGQEHKIKIKWLNENGQEMPFTAHDTNGNGKLDYVEWTVPHLSTQTFEIIFISKAFLLDENRELVADIYDEVSQQDGTWITVPSGYFVKVTFEKFLTNKNDITLYARSAGALPTGQAGAQVEVYPAGIDTLITAFPSITSEDTYQVLLTAMSGSGDTFDLKAVGDLEIDYIVDPTPVSVADNFADETLIASKWNVTVNTTDGQVTLSASTTWTCGDALLDARDGKTYGTVLIGAQCWMQQNLNAGTLVLGSATQGTSCASIEKYCYNDTESNCDLYGGLYKWDQVMCGGTSAGATGICPSGWHIPTHDEFTTLERATCTSGSCETDFPYDIVTTGYRGTDEGTTMKNAAGDFRGLLAGNRTTGAAFSNLGTNGYFWSSVESGTSAWGRLLNSSQAGVYRFTLSQATGFSLRCLKD